jgi:multicomponent Na+:H+ antiporter subunit E
MPPRRSPADHLSQTSFIRPAGNDVVRPVVLGAVLGAFWIILSGHFDTELLTYGVISVGVVLFVSLRMRLVDDEGFPIALVGRFAVYFFWLMKETFIANVTVAKLILNPRLPIDPRILKYKVSQKTPAGRVIYANSITLTPGTNTMLVTGDVFEVHALTGTAEDREFVEQDAMDRWVTWVEEGGRR